jgi:pullulanase/glycogen debranching enzyme
MFNRYKTSAGEAYPLGATVTSKGINFALFSAHAERVDLCIFDRFGMKEVKRFELNACTEGSNHERPKHRKNPCTQDPEPMHQSTQAL